MRCFCQKNSVEKKSYGEKYDLENELRQERVWPWDFFVNFNLKGYLSHSFDSMRASNSLSKHPVSMWGNGCPSIGLSSPGRTLEGPELQGEFTFHDPFITMCRCAQSNHIPNKEKNIFIILHDNFQHENHINFEGWYMTFQASLGLVHFELVASGIYSFEPCIFFCYSISYKQY